MTAAPTAPEAGSPRFGVWSLVYGTVASLHHRDDPIDASWERNRAQIVEAERLGYDCTLVAQHLINPIREDLDQLETWTACAALAEATERIEIIAAIKPSLFHPVVAAKMALQIEEISRGRFAINFVNAWFRPELEQAGIEFREHDQRYEYGTEWLTVVESLMRGVSTTHHGVHFQVESYTLRPPSRWRLRPRIYAGGESPPALKLVGALADDWFLNGQPLEDVVAKIETMRVSLVAPRSVRFGLSAFVIARSSDALAQDALQEAWNLAERDRAAYSAMLARKDSAASATRASIGTNGGTAAGLVGSYDTVAQRICDFHDAGVTTFLVQFQPFEAEMARFAHEVMPRVRERIAARAGSPR